MEHGIEAQIPDDILSALEDLSAHCDEATEAVAWIALSADSGARLSK